VEHQQQRPERQEARGHDRARHGSPLECLRHHDGAADPCRRKRLIDEQLREAELIGRRQWQPVTGCAGNSPEDLALCQARRALQAHRQYEPPRLGPPPDVKELPAFGDMKRRHDDGDQDRGAEHP
jgi:hypothetical protein